MKKSHVLSLLLAAALLICAIAVCAAPRAKAEETPHVHCVCGGKLEGAALASHNANDGACADVEWTAWSDPTTLPLPTEPGNYYLTTDVELSAVWYPGSSAATRVEFNLCLNGHTIKSATGARLAQIKNVTLGICDCSEAQTGALQSRFDSSSAGAARILYMYNNTTGGAPTILNLYGGTFEFIGTPDEAKAGNLIHVGNNTLSACAFNMYGGTLKGGFGIAGGAVQTANIGQFHMYGGTITGSTAAKGAIYRSGTSSSQKITLSGNVRIYGNGGNDLWLNGTHAITVSNLDTEDRIGVSTVTAGSFKATITGDNIEKQAGSFFSADPAYAVVLDDNAATLSCATVADNHIHCVCGGKCAGVGDHTCVNRVWTEWTEAAALPAIAAAGNYCLATDVELSAVWYPCSSAKTTKVMNLSLNGHTIKSAASARLGQIKNMTLNIGDCSEAQTGALQSQFDASSAGLGRLLYLYNNTTDGAPTILNLYGGTCEFIGTKDETKSGTLICVGNSALDECVFNLYGGTITGGFGTGAGAVLAQNSGHFRMQGGTITGGSATNGGAVGITSAAAKFTMDGGTITGCSAENGGAVSLTNGAFIMNGGTIKDCTSTAAGGSVAVNKSTATFTMNGGVIENGAASAANGGNVAVLAGTFTMNGGEITGGQAVRVDSTNTYGGNISASAADAVVELNGGTISGGQATYGGNVYANTAAAWTIGAVEIKDGVGVYYTSGTNKLGGNGGNVYIAGTTEGKITFNGTTISGGTGRAGGNVAAFGVATMNDCTITNGTANVYGNVYLYNNGNLTLNNCTVENGCALTSNGANIGLSNDGTQKTTLVLNGGKVGAGTFGEENTSGRGNGIYLDYGNVVLKGDLVMDSGNEDIYFNNSVVVDYRFQSIDATELNTTDKIAVYAQINGAFAKGTDAQIAMFETAKTGEGSEEIACSCANGYLYLTREGSAEIRNAKGETVGSYYSVAEAVNHLEAGQYIFQKYETHERVLYTGAVLYLDTNGKNIRGSYELGAETVLYGMNSATNSYENDTTYFYADITNGTVAPHAKAPNAKRYLATGELRGTAPATGKKDTRLTRYSFDRFYVGITAITLNPVSGEVGYKAIVGGNENVKAALAAENAFGFNVQLEGYEPISVSLGSDAFVTGSTGNKQTLTIAGQLAAVNADPSLESLSVTANAFITLADGTVITSADYSYTLPQMFKLFDNNFAAQTDATKNSLSALYKRYEVMSRWDLTNIDAYGA